MTRATLIMPLYNEAADIPDVLQSLADQIYAHDALFVAIVDGGSSDGSRELAEAWLAARDFPGEVIVNERRTTATSLNAGMRRVRPGDIVIRLDAHTTYASDYVQSIILAFERSPDSIGCVGGARIPRFEARFDLALAAALYTNPLGLGGAAFPRATRPSLACGVYLGAWRPGVLEAAGGFDEQWEVNEDGELAARVRGLGYCTLFIPVASEYRVKRGPLAAVRQWGRYGYWRARTLRRHPQTFRSRQFAPPLALIVTAALLLTPLRVLAGMLYAMYAIAIWVKREPGESPLVTLASCVFFPAAEAAWVAGLLRGLIATPWTERFERHDQHPRDAVPT